jgi:hypothetical protein
MSMDRFPRRPTPTQAEEMVRSRRGRNIAMLVVLLALCALFFAITVVKMGSHP